MEILSCQTTTQEARTRASGKNYRPVSNLSLISKITEKSVLNQIIEHFYQNAPLPEYQIAYRANYGCESALLELHNDILWQFENQRICALFTMDLSAAFDTVDHNLLLTVLKNRFGIQCQAIKWIESYLRPRGMKVKVEGDYSTVRDTPFAVPQGSCLGPYLYFAYASALEDVVDNEIGSLTGFADDHGLRNSFSANSRDEEFSVVQGLEKSLATIKQWMGSNKLQMNPSKTELILFGNRSQLDKCVTSHITVSGDRVERSSDIKYFGVILDESLSLRRHIISKCQTASYHLHNIRLLRNSLTVEACKQVVYGLVLSHLDFCNSIYMGLPKIDIKRMQRIQNAAAKLVLNCNKYESSTEALKILHWLPIKLRILFKY